MTLATALAAPVDDGMMLPDAALPPRQSFFEEPSTVGCDAVMACTVVIRPRLMPKASWTALTIGARPFVVHEAHETAVIEDSYVSWFTPITTVWESSLAGAENTIFLASAFKCGSTFSVVKNTPVDSQTYSAPCSLKGISAGSRVWDKAIFLPSMTKESPSTSMVPSYLPWMESYFALISFSSTSGSFMAMRATWRPMRPKPLMAMPVARIATDDARPTDRARAAAQLAKRAHTAPVANAAEPSPCNCWPSRLRPAGPAAARTRGTCDGAMKALDTYQVPAAAAARHAHAGAELRAMAGELRAQRKNVNKI